MKLARLWFPLNSGVALVFASSFSCVNKGVVKSIDTLYTLGISVQEVLSDRPEQLIRVDLTAIDRGKKSWLKKRSAR